MIISEIQPVSVDFASYQADSAFSASDLKIITKQNARALWHSKFNELAPPKVPTPAMKFGTMFHAMILENDSFYSKFKVVEDKRTKKGKEQALEYEKQGITVITPQDAALADNMLQSICSNSVAWELLDKGQSEQSFWWSHSATGLDLKCRCDKINGDTIVDLKTTGEGGASPESFTKTITNFNYHLQAAHYLQGTNCKKFVFVVIEKVFPFNIGVYELDDEFLDLGYEIQEQALLKIFEANQSGKWLGYTDTEPNGIQTLEKPYWLSNND
jgi:exodeoxyribonuclease VIII